MVFIYTGPGQNLVKHFPVAPRSSGGALCHFHPRNRLQKKCIYFLCFYDLITFAAFRNNYSVQLLCGEAVSGDDVQILREVAGAVAHVERQQTDRWQKINKEQIKTKAR